MPTPPLVSVVIPTYYREEELRAAIESALDQTYSDVEIVVVDDSGERYAESIVEEYEATYLAHEENQGGNPARNTGIERARGKYVQLLDDDDRIYPEKLSRQVELLESSPSVGVAYGGIKKRNGREVLPTEMDPDESLEAALQFGWWTTITSSLLVSREALLEIYPLTSRKAADDVGFKIELARRTDFDYVAEILTEIGDSEIRRSTSLAVADELLSIVDEYEALYDQYPEYVRANALSYAYTQKGHLLLEDRVWSPTAIGCFVKAMYYRGVNLRSLAAILLSLFGAPGVKVGRYLLKKFRLER